MFIRIISTLVVLAVASYADASVATPPRRIAEAGMREAVSAARLRLSDVTPSSPYRLTSDTEVWLDGRPADYGSIPEGSAIEFVRVTPNGAIVEILFRSLSGPPSPRVR